MARDFVLLEVPKYLTLACLHVILSPFMLDVALWCVFVCFVEYRRNKAFLMPFGALRIFSKPRMATGHDMGPDAQVERTMPKSARAIHHNARALQVSAKAPRTPRRLITSTTELSPGKAHFGPGKVIKNKGEEECSKRCLDPRSRAWSEVEDGTPG